MEKGPEIIEIWMQVSQHRLLKNENLRKYLGLASVPLPHPVGSKAEHWKKVLPAGVEASNHDRSQVMNFIPNTEQRNKSCVQECACELDAQLQLQLAVSKLLPLIIRNSTVCSFCQYPLANSLSIQPI